MEFNTALYLRLSREDDKKEDLSESIKNQQSFLLAYAKQHNFKIIDIFIDDGFSGTTFERPAFKEMLKKIESGEVNTVITKDMSRLGRDYIATGHYIEKYFPEHNVRYIAVNDGIDTYKGEGGDIMPFKSIINDIYAKDISQKVRTALDSKKKNGKFIGSYAPYGYKKDEKDKNKLIIDTETAQYVKMIFDMCLQGDMLLSIANKLSLQGIPTPSESKNLLITQKRFKGVWNDVMVKRILTNPTYIGNLSQNRTKKLSYKIKKRIHLPPEQWINIEGTHEPIIEKKTFEAVQRILTTRIYKTKKHKPNLLTGMVFCADCLSPMCIMRDSSRVYLVCSAWRKHGKLKLCTSHTIREDIVISEVLKALKNLSDEFINPQKLEDACLDLGNTFTDTASQAIKRLKNKIYIVKKSSLNLYKDKIAEVISAEEYSEMSQSLREERKEYETRLLQLENDFNQLNSIDNTKNIVRELLLFNKAERNVLILLVDKIYIKNDKSIHIKFAFKKPVK